MDGVTPAPYRIVVGIDRTRHSRDALALAQTILGDRPGWLAVAHVYDHRRASTRLHTVESWLAQNIGRVDTPATGHAIADPSPANALHQLAREVDADLIVVGSSHRGPTGHVLVGDDGARVVHDAPCAVAIAPSGWLLGDRLEVIGVAYDGSAEAGLAVAQAEIIARAAHARLRLVLVAEDLGVETADAGVTVLQRALVRLGGRADGELRGGPPVRALAAAAASVDLMVIGSRSRGILRRVLGGVTSIGLMQQCSRPVLITPRGLGIAGSSAQRRHERGAAQAGATAGG